MAEILIDAKFWNKAFKHMRPATVVWVKSHKGSGRHKIFPAQLVAVVSKEKVNPDFMLDLALKAYSKGRKTSSYLRTYDWTRELVGMGFTAPRQREISKAIALVAIEDGVLPETVLFGKSRLIKPMQGTLSRKVVKGFVYFVRNGEIHKVGITDNLLRRFAELRPDEVLNVVRCSNYRELEKDIHKACAKDRIPQTEYFRLSPQQIEVVHDLMSTGAVF